VHGLDRPADHLVLEMAGHIGFGDQPDHVLGQLGAGDPGPEQVVRARVLVHLHTGEVALQVFPQACPQPDVVGVLAVDDEGEEAVDGEDPHE
jgi:hypothetical protein